jgi:hypothetical protein
VFLGALVGKVVANPAPEHLSPRRQVELLDAPATLFFVVFHRAQEPVAHSADVRPGASDADYVLTWKHSVQIWVAWFGLGEDYQALALSSSDRIAKDRLRPPI